MLHASPGKSSLQWKLPNLLTFISSNTLQSCPPSGPFPLSGSLPILHLPLFSSWPSHSYAETSFSSKLEQCFPESSSHPTTENRSPFLSLTSFLLLSLPQGISDNFVYLLMSVCLRHQNVSTLVAGSSWHLPGS